MRANISLILIFLILSGCASFGEHFARIPDQHLQLGETKKEFVLSKIGQPQEEKVVQVNGVDVVRLSYYHTIRGEEGEGAYKIIIPRRIHTFFFLDDVLVGHMYRSSHKSDSTFFEDASAESLKEGMSLDAVIKTMGKPHGRYIYPFVEKGMSQIGYNYYFANSWKLGTMYNENRFLRRILLITINTGEQIVEITLSKSGKLKPFNFSN